MKNNRNLCVRKKQNFNFLTKYTSNFFRLIDKNAKKSEVMCKTKVKTILRSKKRKKKIPTFLEKPKKVGILV